MTDQDCRDARSDSGHLFTCSACRLEARIAVAWKDLPRPETQEERVVPEAEFVQAVVRSVARDRARRVRARLAFAAAAALLFFFFAGTGHETAGTPSDVAEGSYTALVAPNVLDGLIPN